MVRFIDFAFAQAWGYGRAAYAAIAGHLYSPIVRSHLTHQRQQLGSQLDMAKLKGFNRWVTVLLSKTTTVAQVLTWHWGLRDVALQALQVTELKEKQKRHDIHLEQAKLGLIFYQLFAQIPGYGGTSLSSMSWCSAIAHTNVALDFVGKPGVVDRSKIVVRAIQRHAEQSGAGLYRTEAGSEFTVLEKQCPLPHGRPFGAP